MLGKEYGEVGMTKPEFVVVSILAVVIGWFFGKVIKFFSNPENYN